MDSTKSLTGLCTVCYAEKPKYRCPRCKSQTCSLPCYKRHQQRASCNGQRNQAAFVKKSQWATPSGIDHDYNYLKSVEKTIEQAEVNVRPSGSADSEHSRHKRDQWRSDSALQRYLTKNNISVQKAPEGMSRSRTNKTRVTQKGNVFWTVEFVDEAGNSVIDNECADTSKICDLHAAAISKKRKASQREHAAASTGTSKRRKPDFQDAADQPQESTPLAVNEIAISPIGSTAEPKIASGPLDSRDSMAAEQNDASEIPESRAHTIHFYLGLPNIKRYRHVVTHVDAQQNVTEILQNRTVQEYPTVYALSTPPDQLTQPFKLEGTLQADLQHEPRKESKAVPATAQVPDNTEQRIRPEKILEMLRRDLT